MTDQNQSTEDDLVEQVAYAICEIYGDVWGDIHESGIGLGPSDNPARDDFRAMARGAIAVVRQWDADK